MVICRGCFVLEVGDWKEGQFCIEEVVETLSSQLPFLSDINRKGPACLVSSLIQSSTMKIYRFNFSSLVLINGLLSTVVAARLKCSIVNIENGIMKIRSKGRLGVYKCNSGFYLLGTPYTACIKGRWDSQPPDCLRPGCPTISNMLNGYIQSTYRSSLIKFRCKPGFRLIGPEYIYCNGRRWSGMQPYCKAIDINCDFESENTCNWKIEKYDDDFNWRLQQYEPPSRILRTGPLHDHTLSPNNTGHYLVLETSDYTSSSRPGRILSPIFPQPSDDNFCFIFWYHMYGNTIGTLNVFLNNILIFQRRGNHGDRWIKGVISLHENVTSSQLQLIIEGSHGGGYTGDIGLDDFSITNGTDCIASKVTSCVGRCYEDHEDTAFCLCNPECLTDSSCCKDFVEVCSLESTTSFFEASTVAEDSTKVDTDSTGTAETELYTNNPEMHTSTSELETVDKSEHLYTTGSTIFISTDLYTTAFISNSTQFEKEEYNSTNSTSGQNIFSSLLETNHPNRTVRFHNPNIFTTDTTDKGTSSTIKLFLSLEDKILTNLSDQSTTKPTLTINKNSYLTDNSTGLKGVFKYLIQSNNSYHSKPLLTHNITKILIESPFKTPSTGEVYANTLNLDLMTTTDKTNISYRMVNAGIVSTTTVKVPFTTTQSIFKKVPVNTTLTVIVSQDNNKSATLTASRDHEISTMLTTTSKYVTENKQVPPISTEVFITESSLPLSSTKKVPLIASTSISSSRSHMYISKNISTILPKFHNSTAKSFNHTNITLNKVNNNQMNGSHTHLQITSQMPQTSKQLLLATPLETSTVQSKHYNLSQFTKWKSIYKPKERFMFSAVLSDTTSGKETYIALLVCAVVIGAISVTLVIYFLKRRQGRLVNEVEDADTDILYHSSQEMLNLHVAQQNLL